MREVTATVRNSGGFEIAEFEICNIVNDLEVLSKSKGNGSKWVSDLAGDLRKMGI